MDKTSPAYKILFVCGQTLFDLVCIASGTTLTVVSGLDPIAACFTPVLLVGVFTTLLGLVYIASRYQPNQVLQKQATYFFGTAMLSMQIFVVVLIVGTMYW